MSRLSQATPDADRRLPRRGACRTDLPRPSPRHELHDYSLRAFVASRGVCSIVCAACRSLPAARPPSPASAASRPTARSAAPKSKSIFSGGRLADAQEILFYEPGITVTQPRSRPTTARSRPSWRSPPTAGWAFTPCASARPPASATCARSRVGDSAGSQGSRAEQRLRRAAADQPRTSPSAASSTTKTSITSSSSQEGRADHRRARRAAAGQHVLRSLRGDSRTPAASSWPAATTRRCCARTASARSSPRKTASTSSRFARARSAATAPASIACTSAAFRGRPPSFPPAASRAKRSNVHWLGDAGRRVRAARSRCPTDGQQRRSACSPRTPAASPPRPTCSASSTWPTRWKSSRTTTLAQATPGCSRPAGAERRHREAGRRRLLQVHRQEGPAVRRPRLRPQAAPLAARFGARRSTTLKAAAIAGNDDSGGPDSYLRFAVPADGDYLISVHDHLKAGGADYAYRVEITAGQAVADAGACPSGSSTCSTTLAGAARTTAWPCWSTPRGPNFGGDLNVDVQGPAAGRDRRDRADGRQPQRRAGAVHRRGRRAAGRRAGRHRRHAGRSES